MNNKFLFFILLLSMPLMVCAVDVAEDPKEREILEISKKLRCTVCQNQPISESRSKLAGDMRDVVAEQLARGKSEQQILQYFVERYGDYVLIKPPSSGNGLLVWAFPPLLLITALIFAVTVMRRRATSTPANKSAVELSEEDRERIQRARKEDKE